MLKMLTEVGITVRATAASGRDVVLRDARSAAMRAAVRRATWAGRQLRLHEDDATALTPASRADRLAAVARRGKDKADLRRLPELSAAGKRRTRGSARPEKK